MPARGRSAEGSSTGVRASSSHVARSVADIEAKADATTGVLLQARRYLQYDRCCESRTRHARTLLIGPGGSNESASSKRP